MYEDKPFDKLREGEKSIHTCFHKLLGFCQSNYRVNGSPCITNGQPCRRYEEVQIIATNAVMGELELDLALIS